VLGRSELHTSPVVPVVGGCWGRVGVPVGWGVSAVVGGNILACISAVVAMSQSVVVKVLGAVAKPSTDHSILAALNPIIFALCVHRSS